ncbi:MAG: tRNA 2-thiocytidine(32) synthetase TtcA [Pseudomonadota bacterium]|nr:tRNA 2-thiocytidine(32) synthetase TtcA [Pseudomonadota bacterium]
MNAPFPPQRSRTLIRLQDHLQATTGRAIGDYGMIADGDTVMVCMSGGKDSHALLDLLLALQRRAPARFRLIAVNVDQKQPNFPEHVLPQYLEGLGVDYRIVEADTYSVVREKIPVGKTTCSLCSRLRRGVIYRVARELGANKIALGHHRDDVLETLFLNLFFGGRMKSMPPKLATDSGEFVVIRPLYYCTEKDIAAYARGMQFPIIPCDLCGSQENLKRRTIKDMLQGWERETPGRLDNIFRGVQNVTPSHLGDPGLYDFLGLTPGGQADPDGDTLFDPPNDKEGFLRLERSEGTRIHFVRRQWSAEATAVDAAELAAASGRAAGQD